MVAYTLCITPFFFTQQCILEITAHPYTQRYLILLWMQSISL